MPNESNVETKQAIIREIKELQNRCIEACNIIENSCPEPPVSVENEDKKILCYLEGVRTEIQNSNTPISTDENLLTSQYLNELKEKTSQVVELTAFTSGVIYDVEAEINRLNHQIKIAEEAKSRPRVHKQQVRQEHLDKAKEKFHLLKNELHGLIGSLFPDKAEAMKTVLGNMMNQKLFESSNGYLTITSELYSLVEILRDRNIVTVNPYNNMEVKLAF